MVSKAFDLMKSARNNGVQIFLNEGQLQLKFSKTEGIDPQLLAEIKLNKELLTEFLNSEFKSHMVQPYEAELLKIDRSDYARVPLSFGQERLWFIDRLNGSVQYHIPAILRLKGTLNVAALSSALKGIVNRHEVLRTVIKEEDGCGWQQMLDAAHWTLDICSDAALLNNEAALQHYTSELVQKPFDLSADFMLRATLINIGHQEHVLVVTMHHIASDGWSVSILVKELVELYKSFAEGRKPALEPLQIQYAEYALWQRHFLEKEIVNNKLAFWKDCLKNVPVLELPTDFARPVDLSTRGDSINFRIDEKDVQKLSELGRESGASLFMTLLAVFKILLSRYSRQNDICVGTPVAGRQYQELEGLIGYFVNTLAIRSDINQQATFYDTLKQVRTNTIRAFEHQEVPFEKIVEAVVTERDLSHSPLVQVMFVFQNVPPVQEVQLENIQLSNETPAFDHSKFDLSLTLRQNNGALQGVIRYNTDLFKASTIERFIGHYTKLLSSVASNANQPVGSLSMIDIDEKQQLLFELSTSSVSYPKQKTIVDIFESHAKQSPNATALVCDGVQLTYQQLNQKANQLASYLHKKNVSTETLVPICLERSVELIVAVLAVLKAGGAYVPVSPDYPADRIEYILQDTRAKLVITDSIAGKNCPIVDGIHLVEIDKVNTELATEAAGDLQLEVAGNNLCYVIYTSGSTGRPKGVMIEHHALLDHVFGVIESAGLASCQSFALFSPLVFDAGHSILFSSLALGAALHVLPSRIIADGQLMHSYFREHNIDCLKIVPSPWLTYAAGGNIILAKKVMIFGGEPFSLNIIGKLKDAGYTGKVFNHYGPTEATIGKTIHHIDLAVGYHKVPIGKPFSNTRLYILDEFKQPVPIGVPGELYIAGDGIARGYLNLPGLTAEKFVDDTICDGSGGKLYKTGDVCRWLIDGNIEYISRADDQVKIRGYRIEPSEIEKIALNSTLVKQISVVAFDDKIGNKKLVGFIVPAENFNSKKLVSYLQTFLPDYMVPNQWVELSIMPLTVNGKIDKKALQMPELFDNLGNEYVLPVTETEKRLAEMWQNLLGVEKIGTHDNFFELGGHSLLTMRLISILSKQLNIDLALKDIFLYPTIAKLAAHIEGKQTTGQATKWWQVNERPQQVPLSYGQERLWFIDQLNGSVEYHVPAVFLLKGVLNIEALQSAFAKVVQRHQVLRTVFREEQGKANLTVLENPGFSISISNNWLGKKNTAEIRQYIKGFIETPFNLASDLMIRVLVLPVEEDENLLVAVLHHIASDGWSRAVLVKEIEFYYNTYNSNKNDELPVLPLQYSDFAIWQRSHFTAEELANRLGYWKEKLENVTPLALPTDYARGAVQSHRGNLVGCSFSNDVYNGLKEISRAQGATLFMTLLSAFKVLLYKYSGHQDICVGLPIAARNNEDLENLIGFFVNTLAIRTNIIDQTSFTHLLQQVKANTVEAFDHADLPFEKVVDAVVKKRDTGRSPIFQVMFGLQNASEIPTVKMDGLELVPFKADHNISKFELTFFVAETNAGLKLSVEYNADLFEADTIKGLMAHFNQLLSSIVATPNQSVGHLSMLSDNEVTRLIRQFNYNEIAVPADQSIVQVFEGQVVRTPGLSAVAFKEITLSYRELNERANQLAHYLLKKGVTKETLVPVCLSRGSDMIVSILGILKAGGAYVPIDADYPASRIGYILEDTRAALLITDETVDAGMLSGFGADMINLKEQASVISTLSKENLAPLAGPGNLAYVIYTSGTTGNPKGVMVEHKGVVNLAISQKSALRLKEGMKTLQFASAGFDASCYEIFNTLLSGGTLVIPEKDDLMSAQQFKGLVEKHRLDLAVLPPSFQQVIKEATGTISTIVSAGEPLNPVMAQHFQAMGIRVINAYGPTENTVCATLTDQPVLPNGMVTIGKPIANVKVYILDRLGKASAMGITGEICLAGAQVARGYLHNHELTGEKFLPDTFSNNPGDRYYRTGDLGRWLPDGNIVYIGRLDDQLKIRGHRIEPGEIEAAILKYGHVTETAVVGKEDHNGSKKLVAFAVVNDDFSSEGINEFLKSRIPEFMLPGKWVYLEKMPLTPSGKIDRNALLNIDLDESSSAVYEEPKSVPEMDLVNAWKDILGVEKVGVNDNFFELGGDSILSIQLTSRIKKMGYSIQHKDLFTYQTISKLAAAISSTPAADTKGEQGRLTGAAGMLPIQQWFFEKQLPEPSYFNQSLLLSIDKSVSADQLQIAVDALTDRHDALRLTFFREKGKWKQQYGDVGTQLVQVDFSELNHKQTLAAQITTAANQNQASLNITRGQLVRVVFIQTPGFESHNRILFIIHHLAVDGVSWRILLEDFDTILSQLQAHQTIHLPAKTSSYRQWHQALEQYAGSRQLLAQKPYWQKVVESFEPIPVDHEGPDHTVAETGRLVVKLPAPATQSLLQDVASVYRTEINDLLLTALAYTLASYTGRQYIHLALEGHGREHLADDVDVSHTVGWFTSVFPLMLKIDPSNAPGQTIKSIKEQLRQVPGKGLGYGVLRYLVNDRDLQSEDPWDVIFNYFGQFDNIVNKSAFISGASESTGKSRSDEHYVQEKISIGCFVQLGELNISWSFSNTHFAKETIENISHDYIENLQKLIDHCLEQKSAHYTSFTPSDFGLSDCMKVEELDAFLDQPVNGYSRRNQVESMYRLSALQEGMIFHSLFEKEAGAYVNQFSATLQNPDVSVLQKTLNRLLQQHTILRTGFHTTDFETPLQVVYREVVFPVHTLDFSDLDTEAKKNALDAFSIDDRRKGFDLEVPPLMRITLVKLGENRWRMFWTSHHVLFDGWSLPIMMEEFLSTYEHFLENTAIPGKPVDKFEDFIRHVEAINVEDQKNYWTNYLQNVRQGTFLPLISQGSTNATQPQYKTLYLHLDKAFTAAVNQFGQKAKITVNTIMQGVWANLLHQYTGSNQVVFGITNALRPDAISNIENRVGLYINTLPLYAFIDGDTPVVDWLQSIQLDQLSSRQYQYSVISDIQKWIGVPGRLFDTTLTFQNFPVSDVVASKSWKLQISDVTSYEQNNFPLTITIGNLEQLSVRIMYNQALIKQESVAQLWDHFRSILKQMVDAPQQPLNNIKIVSLGQDAQEPVEDNVQKEPVSATQNIVKLFEQQAQRVEAKDALYFNDKVLTFGALNARANHLAAQLIKCGVVPGTMVPICVEPGLEMMVGIWAILKAGGAFVPISPDLPNERKKYIVEDTEAGLVLVGSDVIDFAAQMGLQVINLQEEIFDTTAAAVHNVDVAINPDQLAYVIYTSGSTGKPKGVLIEHGSLLNYLVNKDTQYIKRGGEHTGSFLHLSFTFDASLTAIFMPLIHGKALVISSGSAHQVFDDDNLHRYAPYDFIKLTPAHIPLLQDKFITEDGTPVTDTLVVGGEALRVSHFEFLTQQFNDIKIINEYGPTEATVGCSVYGFSVLDQNVGQNSNIPIGKPIANTGIYILNNDNHQLPAGIPGQLCISGAGLARGYLNSPQLSEQKFVTISIAGKPQRIYKTGDSARWLPGGNIEFLGRLDDQVKIRGHRVELGEVESVLLQNEWVKQAVVLAKSDSSGFKQLVAYIVKSGEFETSSMIGWLHTMVPEYMVPTAFLYLDEIPLNINGKVDKKALEEMEITQASRGVHEPPATAVEIAIAGIWKNLLELDEVCINEDFFDIGGHSLMAIRVVSAIRKQLKVELSINDVFNYPTIATLAKHIEGIAGNLNSDIIKTQNKRPEFIPLSFSQERLWFIDRLEGSVQYHVPSVLNLTGNLNRQALEHALKTLVTRHEVLRTVILENDGKAYQSIKSADDWHLTDEDLSGSSEEYLDQYIQKLINQPFNLSADFLLRAHLLKVSDQQYVLVATLHHIASDGWSRSILVKEVAEAYNAFDENRKLNLEPLLYQYADFSIWQRENQNADVFNAKVNYWKNQLADIEPLQLPIDYVRPAVWNTAGASITGFFDKSLSNKLQRISRQQGATMFMTLLAAFKVLLFRYTNQTDVCVGTPIAGRNRQEFESLIGFFINTLALRDKLLSEESFIELLDRVKNTTLQGFDNQEVPFERVVDETGVERLSNRNPLFQVMFVMLNMPEIPVLKLGDLTLSGKRFDHTTTLFDLQFFVNDTPNGLKVVIEYSTSLFKSETIERMLYHFKQLLNSIVEAPQKPIGKLAIMDEEERQLVLYKFNDTFEDYPLQKTVVELIRIQVEKTPEAIAAVFEEEHLTYKQLDEQSNQLAHYLVNKGVKTETPVPICMDRSLNLIIGLLGILKSGGTYVPIDPEYPWERIQFMLEDINARLVLASTKTKTLFEKDNSIEIIDIEEDWSDVIKLPKDRLLHFINPRQLAYIIYTSGSTGKPKGAMNERRSIVNRLLWAQDYFRLTTDDVVLQKTNYCFDVSVWELLWPLLAGSKLVFAIPGGQKDSSYLKEVIDNKRVTILHFVPSMLGAFLLDIEKGQFPHLKKVICSGEPLKPGHVAQFKEKLPHVELFNLYGPTEAAIDVTYYKITHQEELQTVPIGKPLANTSIYILDELGQPVPVGITGEIHIGGMTVGRGYINRPQLTAEKFITDPFKLHEGERLYKTGDLGRWLPDGNIECFGRIDNQVKVRGFRIELGEIENIMMRSGIVRDVVVFAKGDSNGGNRLIGYYSLDNSEVKNMERELSIKRVESWAQLYDLEYEQKENDFDEEFNLVGWNNSFTGNPLSENEMSEWLADIVNIIMEEKPENVLEIGTGTGLIFYQLAGRVKKYIGSDFSSASVRQIEDHISKGLRNYGKAEFYISPAHSLTLRRDEKVDTIILNSVIQYFPSENYLYEVLDKSLELIHEKGRIIIGDVRDNRLLFSFKARLQLNKMQDATSIKEFNWAVESELLKENELCLSPFFFYNLHTRYPNLSHVELKWKNCSFENELTAYRFNVVLHFGDNRQKVNPGWLNWKADFDFETMLNNDPNILALKNVPNPKLSGERRMKEVLDQGLAKNQGELSAHLSSDDVEKQQVLRCLEFAKQKGYGYSLFINDDPFKTDIVFTKAESHLFFDHQFAPSTSTISEHNTNTPLFIEIGLEANKRIKEYLVKHLPDYFIPGELHAINKLPVTGNGKIDTKFLSSRDDRNLLTNLDFLLPQTDTERILANVWQELLGLERIGVNDNFFELGGDSITTIQVVSRMRRHGYELQPRDLFLYQTISRLCAVLAERSGAVNNGEQGILNGEAGLLPIQLFYLQNTHDHLSWFNQSLLLAIDKTVDAERLQLVFRELVQQHDALRFEFSKTGEQWRQHYGAEKANLIVEDLSAMETAEALSNAIKNIATRVQGSLNIYTGEIVKFVHLHTPSSDKYNRLLMVVHHLAIDGVSWRIILEDLEMMLTSLADNNEVHLPSKTTSYRQWHEALVKYGELPSVQMQLPFWQKVTQSFSPLPVDFDKEEFARVKNTSYVTVALAMQQTQQLLQEVPKVYRTEINDLLLASLGQVLADFLQSNNVVIGLEGHGREDVDASIDISRTVGWFTNLYPVLLQVNDRKDPDSLIKSVKEQLRKIPGKGLGYGVLKYINKEVTLQGPQPWDVVFNYLGQFDHVISKSKWLNAAGEPVGPSRHGDQQAQEKLMINSSVKGGQLVVSFAYNNHQFKEETIVKLANAYLQQVERLIKHCLEQFNAEGAVITSTDFGLEQEVSYTELDSFLAEPYENGQRKDFVESIYRLSGLQQGMLFHGLYDAEVIAYTDQFICELENVNIPNLQKTWQHILNKHSVLRSAFFNDVFSIPVQCVYKSVELPFEVIDYRAVAKEEQEKELQAFIDFDRSKGFDFRTAPLMRVSLVQLNEDKYKMVWTYNHILFDGWSMPILMHEFLSTYQELAEGKQPSIIKADKFEDYIRLLERKDKDEEEIFWKKHVEEISESTLLPFIGTSTERTKGLGTYDKITLVIEEAQSAQVQKFAQKNRLTINTILQGIWSYLLHQYTGQSTITYGVIVSGRPDELPEIENRVGMFINTLPLHSTIQEGQQTIDWLKDLQDKQASARQYQHTPLQQIQKLAGIKGDWFDTLLVFENYPVNKVIGSRKWTLQVSDVSFNYQTNYPFGVIISSAEKIKIGFSYNTNLIEKTTVEKIRAHFEHVLMQVVSGVQGTSMLKLITSQEEDIILNNFNRPYLSHPPATTINAQFEEQVARAPLSVAIECKDGALTYAELNKKANQLARYLVNKGVTPETIVPLCIERGLDMIVSIMGILKAGGAYVPIDAGYPAERISYILNDTRGKIVLTSRDTYDKIPKNTEADVVVLEEIEADVQALSYENIPVNINPGNLAYIIYTSGSTGKPKGVMIEHAGVVNLVASQSAGFNLKPSTKTLQFASFGFDASCSEIFNTLITGGTLVLPQMEDLQSPKNFEQFINRFQVELATLPPSFQQEVKDNLGTLRTIVSAGEPLNPTVGRYLQSKGVRLLNGYGPTENTVCVTLTKEPLLEDGTITIGKPLDNVQVYVLDKNQNLCPVGIAGEIVVGGAQLARGYLNKPGLTNEKFIDNPFDVVPGRKMYKTGDLGRWLPDGNIEYLGRIDDQLKIRGFRIEPGEIVNVLQQYPGVNDAVVLAPMLENGARYIVAFVVTQAAITNENLTAYLKEILPEFMIPAAILILDKMPVTPNGKVDKKVLLQLADTELHKKKPYVAPTSETEKKLVEIWESLLKIDKIGIEDNFFELGGNSLLAMRLAAYIERNLMVTIPIKVLFRLRCIKDLSEYLEIQDTLQPEDKNLEAFDLLDI